MKIGMLSGLWSIAGNLDAVSTVSRVADLGFHYIDFQGVLHAGPSHLDEKQVQAIAAALTDHGMEARNYVLHAPYNIPTASEEQLRESYEYLHEGMRTAKRWGIRQLMLNAGRWSTDVSRSTGWSKAVAFLKSVCDLADREGFLVAIESEPYVWFVLSDLESTLRMVRDVDRRNFGILLDLGHCALERQSPERLVEVVPHLMHVHFSDHQAERHTNQVIGTGVCPLSEYVRALMDAGADNAVAQYGYFELVGSMELGFPGDCIPDPEAWAVRSRENIQAKCPSVYP